MGQGSKIEWTHHTFNPWVGCTKVSDGCKFCYAEALMDKRWGKVQWGPQGERKRTSPANWKEPLKWNRQSANGVCVDCGTPCIQRADSFDCVCGQIGAIGKTVRPRVFCASLADVFEDRRELDPWRDELLAGLIHETPNLDWLLLTKRPENVDRLAPASWLNYWPTNVWLGTSVENQDVAETRVIDLLMTGAHTKFLSMEPLLSAVDLTSLGAEKWDATRGWKANASNERGWANTSRVDWIIVGGESGHGARPFNIEWARRIVRDCKAAELPVFVKQLGARPVEDNSGDDMEYVDAGGTIPVNLKDSKGGDWTEWDEDLRVREFPQHLAAK